MSWRRVPYIDIGFFLFVLWPMRAQALESHFFRLDPNEAGISDRLPEEAYSYPARLDVSAGHCHYYSEEIILSSGEDFYWRLPADARLSCRYPQLAAVKIFGHGVRFAHDCDVDSEVPVRNLPHDFLLRRAVPLAERVADNRLIPVSSAWPAQWVSLCYLPPRQGNKPRPAQVVTIFHRLRQEGEASISANGWNSGEALAEPEPVPSFILSSPLATRSTRVDSVALRLEGSSLKRVDNGRDFNFPPGEYILDIQLDDASFHLFWHQKTEDSPYRVFFFNGASEGAWGDCFSRNDYFRYLAVSGACLRDDSHPYLLNTASKERRPNRVGEGICGIGYVGTIAENFHLKYEKIIRAIIEKQGIPESQVLFMGLSMGGFMALKMAEYFPEAHVFAYNFQSDFLELSEWGDSWSAHSRRVWRILNDSEEKSYLSPELRNRWLIHPELVVNDRRCVVCLVETRDIHHHQRQFLPFLHWIRQTPQIRELLHQPDFFHSPEVLELCNGLHAIENDKAGHGGAGREFELRVIDRLLRFMEEKHRQSSSS
jgi:hypothetical protein